MSEKSSKIGGFQIIHYGGVGNEANEYNLTASCHGLLISLNGRIVKILVDYGAYQGVGKLPLDRDECTSDSEYTVITHGHNDHVGALPLHVLRSDTEVESKVFATPRTQEVAKIVLTDSAKIMKEKHDREKARRSRIWKEEVAPAIKALQTIGAGVARSRNGSRNAKTQTADQIVADIRKYQEVLLRYDIDLSDSRYQEQFFDIPKPKFSAEDVTESLSRVRDIEMGNGFYRLFPGVSVKLYNAGHIIGSVSPLFRIRTKDRKNHYVLFSGDVGSYQWDVHPAGFPNPPSKTEGFVLDSVVVESTYGGIERMPFEQALHKYQEIIQKDLQTHDILIHPCFSVDRLQGMLYRLVQMKREGKIGADVQIYVDSLMGCELLAPHRKQAENTKNQEVEYHFSPSARKLIGSEYLENQEALLEDYIHNIDPENGWFTVINSENRDGFLQTPGKKIVVTSSGMMDGGPINVYLDRYLESPKAVFYTLGYMAKGTIGEKLLSGYKKRNSAKFSVEGKQFDVRDIRAKIQKIEGFSGHADTPDMLAYLESMPIGPNTHIVIVHGDKDSTSEALKDAIFYRFGIPSDQIHIGELDQVSYGFRSGKSR